MSCTAHVYRPRVVISALLGLLLVGPRVFNLVPGSRREEGRRAAGEHPEEV